MRSLSREQAVGGRFNMRILSRERAVGGRFNSKYDCFEALYSRGGTWSALCEPPPHAPLVNERKVSECLNMTVYIT